MSRTVRLAAGEPGTAGNTSPFRVRYAAAATARRALPIQSAGRVMSHKLITYFDASIPSCPGRSGARSVGEGTASVPVPCGRPTWVWPAHLLPIYRHLRRHVLRFTAVYALLFYTKILNLLELLSFYPLFSSKLQICSPARQASGCRSCAASTRRRTTSRRKTRGVLLCYQYTIQHNGNESQIDIILGGVNSVLSRAQEVGTPRCFAGAGRGFSGFCITNLCAHCSQLAPIYGCLCPFIFT